MARARRFNADLVAFSELIDFEYSKTVKKTAIDIWGGIIRKTPVDEGFARAGWTISVNADPSFPPGGSPSHIQQAKLDALDREPYSLVVIANPVPYIVALENGHSKQQAPHGMVALTINEVQNGLVA